MVLSGGKFEGKRINMRKTKYESLQIVVLNATFSAPSNNLARLFDEPFDR